MKVSRSDFCSDFSFILTEVIQFSDKKWLNTCFFSQLHNAVEKSKSDCWPESNFILAAQKVLLWCLQFKSDWDGHGPTTGGLNTHHQLLCISLNDVNTEKRLRFGNSKKKCKFNAESISLWANVRNYEELFSSFSTDKNVWNIIKVILPTRDSLTDKYIFNLRRCVQISESFKKLQKGGVFKWESGKKSPLAISFLSEY